MKMPLVVTSVMTKGILCYSDNNEVVDASTTIHLYTDNNIGNRLLITAISIIFIPQQTSHNLAHVPAIATC